MIQSHRDRIAIVRKPHSDNNYFWFNRQGENDPKPQTISVDCDMNTPKVNHNVSEVSNSQQKKNNSMGADSTKDQIIGLKFGKGQKPASSQDC